MSISYEAHELSRVFLNLMRLQAHMTAVQTQALLAPYQAWLNSPFNPMSYWSGTKVKASGLDTLARLNPYTADFMNKLPSTLEISFEAARSEQAPVQGDRKNLKLALSLTEPHKNWDALAEIFNHVAHEYQKPDYKVTEATVLGQVRQITESVLLDKPFASLRLFDSGYEGPLLYIAAPLSGHYGTLIRETIQNAVNAGFRVAVYDTKNARDVPTEEGQFGLDDCVDYHREFIEHLGRTIDPRVNVQAICQATVPVSIAAATLAEEGSPYTPFTLDLEAGPINPHLAMTEVVEFAQKYKIEHFRDNLISRVPAWYDGARRDVYPGFRQLAAFIMMNPDHHTNSFYEMFNHLVRGTEEGKDFQKMRAFYEEYLAVCDLDAKFYLDTIERVFINNDLAEGRMTWHGKPVSLAAYKGPLLTKEASLDDISAPGQTMFAHELMPDAEGYHYAVDGAGHYGIFAGSKSRDKAMPAMFGFIHDKLKRAGCDYGPTLDSYGNILEVAPQPRKYERAMLDSTVKAQSEAWENFCLKRRESSNVAPQITVTFPSPLRMAA